MNTANQHHSLAIRLCVWGGGMVKPQFGFTKIFPNWDFDRLLGNKHFLQMLKTVKLARNPWQHFLASNLNDLSKGWLTQCQYDVIHNRAF